jgi:endonuclease VIII
VPLVKLYGVAEGDTVHRTAQRLEEWLGGRPLRGVSAPSPRSPLRRQPDRLASLEGEALERAGVHGKHLFLRFSGGLALHSHLGMRGSWRLRPRGERQSPPPRTAWALLSSDEREVAQFGGPTLALRTEGELRLDRRLRSLGPDVLGAGFEPQIGVDALRRRTAASDRLGEALVRQTVVSGIGNIFKSEGCWAARVDPWRPLSSLGDEELSDVIRETASLMQEALRTGRQPRRIYRRAGEPCPRCGAIVRSRGQGDANRTTYWCPGCQT